VSANTTGTGEIEFVIVGQDQGANFQLWDVAPAPTDPARRAALMEELGVEAMDALGDLTTEWADSPRAAVEKLLAGMRERSGFDDYGLTADSETDCLGPAPAPATEPAQVPASDLAPYGDARTLSAAAGAAYRVWSASRPGPTSLSVNGLPNRHGIETRDRVRAGVVNSGLHWPRTHLTVMVGPRDAQPQQQGSSTSLDLAIACTALAASGHIAPETLTGTAMVGELGLDGRVRAPRDLPNLVRALAATGTKTVLVPDGTADVLAGIAGVRTITVGSLTETLAVLAGHWHHPQDCVHCTDSDGQPGPHGPCTHREPCPSCCTEGITPVGI
jgi:hypothetical protein